MRHKKHKNYFILITLIIVLLLAGGGAGYFFYTHIIVDNRTSQYDFAATYDDGKCRIYYPDTKTGLETAQNICNANTQDDVEYDFELVQKGDYYLVQYETGEKYFIDQNYQDLSLNNIEINEDSRKLIADFLRYNMKKDELDIAYTSDFLYDTYYENIDLSNLSSSFDEDNLYLYFEEYDYTLSIPLGYAQKYLNMNFGVEDLEYSERLHYVSKERPVICLTYDDGPNVNSENPTSIHIAKNLDTYDSAATFFVVGSRLGPKGCAYMADSIARGNEYGSHTESHSNLTYESVADAVADIEEPADYLLENIGYTMKYFRPPYGSYTREIANASSLKCITWNVDSLDWKLRQIDDQDEAVDAIFDQVMATADSNDVILFHDIYTTSELASKKVMIELIDEGYQVVNISELLDYLEIDDFTAFGGR